MMSTNELVSIKSVQKMTFRIHIEYKSHLKVAHLSDLCFPLTGTAAILWSENKNGMEFSAHTSIQKTLY